MRWIIAFVIFVVPVLSWAEDPPPVPAAHVSAADVLTLDQCVGLALARHPRLVAAGAEIDQTRGAAVQAGLYPNPRLDSGNPQTIGPQRTSVLTTGLTQEVVTAGKLKLDRAAATEASRQSEWNLVRTRFEVLTGVRQEFFATLATQRRRALLENLLVVAKKSEETSKNLFKAEQVSETDVLLLRVERRRAEVSLQTAEISLRGQKRQLAATMGAQNQITIRAVEGSLSVPVKEFDDEQVLAEVLYGSPMVQIAHLDINRTLLLLRRAEVEPIPNLSVQGGFQYSYATDNAQGLIGVYLSIPLWNQNQGNIQAAQASVRRATATREAVQQELARQLADALARFRAAESAVKSYEEGILPDAMRTLDLVQNAYARGEFDITRLLQTQRSLFEANLDYITALENRLLAAAEIAGLLQLDEFP